jgi:2-oxoisovalerate dehydrogenase E2 component (dihydrolipoyl transacylase)
VAEVKQFKLPDVGEGLTEGEILKWFVQPGDTVSVNQTLVEIETAKAAVELPSPWAGVVAELYVAEGQTVDVGTPIIGISVGAGAAAPPAAAPTGTAPPATAPAAAPVATPDPSAIETPVGDEPIEPGLIGGPAPGGRTSVLVGYGPRSVAAKRRPRKQHAEDPVPTAQPIFAQPPVRAAELAAAHEPAETGPVHPAPGHTGAQPVDVTVLAKPPVRKLARDLGVDLRTVTPTGPNGTITRDDIQQAAAPAAAPTVPRLVSTGREERIPIKGVRKHTAAAMVSSAFTAPHVTEFLTVDITPTMELRERIRALPDFAEVKVTPLLFVARALLLAVKRHPMINSAWDEAAQEIVIKHYVNLGIAAATDRGLIVPNIKDADALSLRELAVALSDLTTTARSGKTAPADMSGGTITITNVGMFGVDNGTPILNPGESAILAFGAVRPTPWVVDGQIVPRQVTQLALSFDHRIVDGQLGSEFLADLGAILHDPSLALAWS